MTGGSFDVERFQAARRLIANGAMPAERAAARIRAAALADAAGLGFGEACDRADTPTIRIPVTASAVPVQIGHAPTDTPKSEIRTAGDRRRAVLAALVDPVTSALSAREIARRVGVSPTTVGNLRRRVRQAGEGSGAAS